MRKNGGSPSLLFAKAKIHWQNFVEYAKKREFSTLLSLALQHLGFQRVNRPLIFLVLDLEQAVELSYKPYTFSTLSEEDIRNDPTYDDGFFTKSKALYRIKKGHRLFVLREGNEIAYYSWITTKKAWVRYLNNLPLNLPEDMAYIEAIYTPPQFRNRGIASRMEAEIFRYLKEEGYKRVTCVIHPHNSVSLKVHKRLGFRAYQIMRFRRFWHLRIYTIKKFDDSDSKTVISLFRSPKHIWKMFLS
jgi:RimJ/RimL family protein N-acetyltransferase